MAPDNHRAPSRMAPPRPELGYLKEMPQQDHSVAGTRPSPSRGREHAEIIDSAFYEEIRAVRATPDQAEVEEATYERANGNGTSRVPATTRDRSTPTVPEPDMSGRTPVLSHDALDWPPQQQVAVELSKKERYQLLMHTVQLHEDDWKLASIRALPGNRMAAYLTPRNRHLDLRTAFNRQQILVITLDQLGNTDIKEPPPRNWLQRFLDWLRGG